MAEGDGWLEVFGWCSSEKNLRVKLGGVNPQRVVHDKISLPWTSTMQAHANTLVTRNPRRKNAADFAVPQSDTQARLRGWGGFCTAAHSVSAIRPRSKSARTA
jgi:hypothetical protein